jgi:hypothetical protein
MPRYYFHVRRDQSTIPDHAGIVLAILRTLKRRQHCETHGPTGQSRSIIGPRRTGEASGLVQAANDKAQGASRARATRSRPSSRSLPTSTAHGHQGA